MWDLSFPIKETQHLNHWTTWEAHLPQGLCRTITRKLSKTSLLPHVPSLLSFLFSLFSQNFFEEKKSFSLNALTSSVPTHPLKSGFHFHDFIMYFSPRLLNVLPFSLYMYASQFLTCIYFCWLSFFSWSLLSVSEVSCTVLIANISVLSLVFFLCLTFTCKNFPEF